MDRCNATHPDGGRCVERYNHREHSCVITGGRVSGDGGWTAIRTWPNEAWVPGTAFLPKDLDLVAAADATRRAARSGR
jgi:hypothetical protein